MEVQTQTTSKTTIATSTLFTPENTRRNKRAYWFVRRTQDIFFSALALIVLSPFLVLIALIIWIDSPGASPIFAQDRIGRGGRRFRFYKFRSMIPNAEAKLSELLDKNEMDGPVFKIKEDPRITRVGRFIRKTSIDELPQLFNVFMGDMSLVGPRPERDVIMQEYEQEIPEFHYRLKVKAGLTGYAQVYGKYNTTPYDKLKLDLFYIENYSFLLDIKLLFMTVKIFFQKEVSEGVDDNQKNALKDSEDKK